MDNFTNGVELRLAEPINDFKKPTSSNKNNHEGELQDKHGEKIKLFDQSTVETPIELNHQLEEEQQAYLSEDISSVLAQSTVKTLILPEETTIARKNYIFDFSENQSISVFKKQALKSLLCPKREDGTVKLYLYKKNGSLVEIGVGDEYKLNSIIPTMKNYVFGDEIRIYKDFHVGEPLMEVIERDITKVRLNL